jgi:hypothetical protein
MKLRRVALLLLAAGALAFAARALIGDRVDAEGFLHEPFFLVPTGYALVALGLLLLLFALLRGGR